MTDLTIRVGGRYRTRGGDEAVIIGEAPMTSYCRGGLIDGVEHFWTDDGRYYIGEPSDLDLVSEITEPTAGERLVSAAKEAVAIARGEAQPAAVHTYSVSGGVAERILSGCPDTVGDEFFAMTVESEAKPAKVRALEFHEGRNHYWNAQEGYQVALCHDDIWRVRHHGKVVCRNIRGFRRAVQWANEHNRKRIIAALEFPADAMLAEGSKGDE